MKFDFIIGNPPYQGDKIGDNSRDEPIYNDFMDEAYKISAKTLLITPARFLFNAGATSKKWNEKMLSDPHLKVIYYAEKSSDVFQNTDIKGGVAITYRDETADFGPIGVFSSHTEMASLLKKVEKSLANGNLSDLAYASTSYSFTNTLHLENPELEKVFSKGHKYDIDSNAFERLDDSILFENKPNDGRDYIRLFGRKNNERVIYWIRKDYVREHPNLNKWKVLVPKSNGSGKFGEALSTPVVIGPEIGHTRTFMSFGAFNKEFEAQNLLKYIKTKFLRCYLGALKITQDNPVSVWEKIPLQEFGKNSDIDWSQSISNIDVQLYKKYKLTKEEIDFIETNVKEMD